MTSTIKVNNVQNQCGQNIINENSNTITIGASGDTIALASGASQSGFGRTGTVDWQTAIKTSTITAVNGEGYFVDTSSGALTANLPAGSVGAIVAFKDYAQTFNTNNLTIAANGSEKIEGLTDDFVLNIDSVAVTLVYGDATKGWQAVNSNDLKNASFIVATGGTITTCGNDKIHTFTGPGTFTVCSIASAAANNEVSYVVVAGGGSGNCHYGGGGGAGGYRETKSPVTPYTASPLDGQPSAPNRITVTATAFPITVGAGGATSNNTSKGNPGNNSVFSTITAAAGGGGGLGASCSKFAGLDGGSGGGGGSSAPGSCTTAGSGNTPPVTPPQGQNGGAGNRAPSTHTNGGGGGGAGAAGVAAAYPVSGTAGTGGNGVESEITGSAVTRAGGGGGAINVPGGLRAGGTGGGGTGGTCAPDVGPANATAGTANTGGGGGGAAGPVNGGAGGSGIVIIRYKFQ